MSLAQNRPRSNDSVKILPAKFDNTTVINLTLENDRHHTNYELEAFIRKCRILLPAEWTLKRVRIDSSGFDINNLEYLDEQNLEFTIKCKKYKSLQVLIDSVNHKEHLYPWTDIDETFSVNEYHFRLPKWNKNYRFILIRKPAPVKDKKQQQMEVDAVKYCYQLIVTNIETMTATEIFHDYNQRCDVENKIDSRKALLLTRTVSAISNLTNCFCLLKCWLITCITGSNRRSCRRAGAVSRYRPFAVNSIICLPTSAATAATDIFAMLMTGRLSG